MTTRKQKIREQFRRTVFERDEYRCVTCGKQSAPDRAEDELDAHHITPRHLMPAGGYVAQNGVSLCKRSCHSIAERQLEYQDVLPPLTLGDPWYKYTPKALYEAIGSTYEEAFETSTWLALKALRGDDNG